MIPRPDVKITDLFKQHKFTLSAEIIPPRNGTNPKIIYAQIETLKKSGAQYLSVTKGAGGSLRGGSLPIAQIVKESFNTPCIAHFTCRDLLPEEVENQLIDHHFFGIRNILALRGDPPQGVPNWKPREGSYSYAFQLVEQITALNRGTYLSRPGFEAPSKEKTDFCIGVACYPDHPDARESREFFKKKVDAGAEYAISQMLFCGDSYARFKELTQDQNIPILPGTRLVKSKEQALRMAKRFEVDVNKDFLKLLPDTDAESSTQASIQAFLSLVEQFKKHEAPGVHIFVLSDTDIASEALKTIAVV